MLYLTFIILNISPRHIILTYHYYFKILIEFTPLENSRISFNEDFLLDIGDKPNFIGHRPSCSSLSITDNKIHLNNIITFDGAFSIETGLELAGVAGPVCRVGSVCNLHRNSGPVGGVSVASLMAKSVSFL